jgi:hypothetical protein
MSSAVRLLPAAAGGFAGGGGSLPGNWPDAGTATPTATQASAAAIPNRRI